MAKEQDDLLGEDTGFEEFADNYHGHRVALYERILDYAEEHELDDAMLVMLLTDLTCTCRMTGYVLNTEKPSVGGLKLDLDRFLSEVGKQVREAKKGADDFIQELSAARSALSEDGDGA